LKERSKSDITFDQFFPHFLVIFSVQKYTTLLEVLDATFPQMFRTFIHDETECSKITK